MRRHVAIAGGLVGLGLLCLVVAITTAKSVRGFVRDTYRPAGTRQVEGGGRSELYDSSKSPSATAEQIADAVKPGDRRVAPAGVFLRYDKDIVSVVPRPGGSRVILEDERTGYRSGFFYLGGFWGTYSGRGESFRGGGPGGGK
jgi:hypothetical protein